jgi:hypothetical protein
MLVQLLRMDEDRISERMLQCKRKWKRVTAEPNDKWLKNYGGVRDF